MMTPLVLIVVGLLSRLLPHPNNAVALGAIALYAGARLPRRWAAVVPLAILVVSDVILNTTNGYRFYPATSLTTYATFTLVAVLGGFVPKNADALTRAGMSVSASTLFFLASNLVVWAEGSGYEFPRTLQGLLACYSVAIPFFANSMAADLVGTGALFGLDALFNRGASPEVEAGTEAGAAGALAASGNGRHAG